MPTREEIEDRMFSSISQDYDKTEGSIIYDAVTGVSIGLEDAYIEMEVVKGKAFVDNLVEDELTMKVDESGVTRKLAVAATTQLQVTGTDGTIIPVGFRCYVDDIYYVTTETKSISAGTATILIRCEVAGSIGNVPANSIVNFEPLTGITAVTNPSAVINGIDEETDDDLLIRFYEHVHTPATSGNKQHYINWCKEVAGVSDAKIFPLWNGNGTVKCAIINSNKRAADQTIIDAVAAHIEEKRPILANVTVESATELAIDVSVDVTLITGYELATVTTAITTAITDYLKTVAFKDKSTQDVVSYAQIGALILDVPGISDYQNLTLNTGIANITIPNTSVAVVGVINVT